MARKNGLNCLEKRDLLNQSAVSVETLLHWGRYFEESGLLYDAVDFYEKANAKEAFARLFKEALEDGNVFLFKRLCHLTGHEPGRDEWVLIARRAEESGKYAFAAEAYRQCGENELADRYSLTTERA